MAASLNTRTIAIIGTCDTKLNELVYLHDYITTLSNSYRTSSPISIVPTLIDIGKENVAEDNPMISKSVSTLIDSETKFESRNDLVSTVGTALKTYVVGLAKEDRLHGVLAIGGSCGSSIASEALQALPFGFPKMLLSTMASGDIKPYVGCSDISVMYSVVDISGLNTLLKSVLENAAGAIVGMVASKATALSSSQIEEAECRKKKVAMTMFGITTPACNIARQVLEENNCEVYVFHATGSGGMAMEKLIMEGAFDGVLDLTTTELADEAFGGVLSAGSDRLKAAFRTSTPTVISVGALDCINFGPRDTVPPKFEGRNIHVHNSAVTLVRTNLEENQILGKVICDRIKENVVDGKESLVKVWIPTESVSLLDQDGAPFRDQGADLALYDTIKKELLGSKVEIVEMEAHINDHRFAEAIAHNLLKLM